MKTIGILLLLVVLFLIANLVVCSNQQPHGLNFSVKDTAETPKLPSKEQMDLQARSQM